MANTFLLCLFVAALSLCSAFGQQDSSTQQRVKFDRIFGGCYPMETDTAKLDDGDLIIYHQADSSIRRVTPTGKVKWKKPSGRLNAFFSGFYQHDYYDLDRFVLRPYDLKIWVCHKDELVLLSSKSGKMLVVEWEDIECYLIDRLKNKDLKVLKAQRMDDDIRSRKDMREYRRDHGNDFLDYPVKSCE